MDDKLAETLRYLRLRNLSNRWDEYMTLARRKRMSVERLLKQVLEDRGDTVTCASNGVEGIKEYRSHPADLIILDILMPEKEGLETILDLRREFPQVKIIAMSGGSERGSHGDCSRPRERSCAGQLARKVSSGLYARIISAAT